jgi:hypothetical protein
MTPGSGMGKKNQDPRIGDPDPGRTTRSLFPRASGTFFDVDLGWTKFESGINRSTTLMKIIGKEV